MDMESRTAYGLPYPVPSSSVTTAVMKGNRRANTSPEVVIRGLLHRRGHRFRKDYPIRGTGRRIRADIAFPRQMVAVFVDGCFWHRCPQHGHYPKSNQEYWRPKLDRNRQRDELHTRRLAESGWVVVRVWEHTPVEEAVKHIEFFLGGRV